MITSLENNFVKKLCKLHLKKYREDSFLLTDEKLIASAKENNYLKTIVYSDKVPFEFSDCIQVSQEVLDKIADKKDLSYIGVSKMINYSNDYQNRVILCDHLQDPLNIGRIMEAAKYFNFDSIVLSSQSADIYNEKCLDNCKGTLFDLNIYYGDLLQEIDILKQKGFKIYATGLSANTVSIYDIESSDKMAFVLGNEGCGVSDTIMKECEKTLKIDMGNIDSLNVAMAGSIIMYHFKK